MSHTVHYVCSTFVTATPESLYAFHQSPHNISSIAAPFPPIRVLAANHVARVGDTFELVIEFPVRPLKWLGKWLVTEEPSRLVDTVLAPPIPDFHHEHRFDPAQGGATMTDTISFSIGKIPGAALLAWSFQRVILPVVFADRHRKTRRHFRQ